MVLAAAVAAYVHFHRFDGGPLDVVGASGGRAATGQSLSFPMLASNSSDGPVTIERATPTYVAPGTRVKIWGVTNEKIGQLIGGPFPPEDSQPGDLRAAEGFVVPRVVSGHGHFILAEIERTAAAPRGACIGIKGITLEYKTGWRRYRRKARVLAFARPPGVTDCQSELAEP